MKRWASSRIAGLGHAAPDRVVDNSEIETMLGLDDGWIERRTGIRTRRWAHPGQTLTDMAAEAGRMALDDGEISAAEIGLVLLATSTPDHLLPPSAPLVCHKIGLKNAGAIDLAGACSGFLYALGLADGFVRLHGKGVLIIAANILSRRINMRERASAVVFADAAGAAVLKPSSNPQRGITGMHLTSEGEHYDLISIPAGGGNRPFATGMAPEEFTMNMRDGQAVFSHAVRIMSASAGQAMRQAGLPPEAITRFIPHQANARIFDAVGERLGIAPDRMVRTIAAFGNSSAATIPLSLSLSHREKPLSAGENLLLAAAGAGLTGGAAVIAIGTD